ncbi:hypothetical protein GQ607_002366 [Colletotrichum asianum]|uniref:Uncharacterized protein n=1 Tax=Colletotrichum asianum TaxID=702518 RepID=A0A8H3ZWC1_9PEZI|nr:hypothetical protein GQ607_002366 [Colletotrichum asianum]
MEPAPKQDRPGVTALKLPAKFLNLVQEADNLITNNGRIEPGQLKSQDHPDVIVSELPWTDQKTEVVKEFMKQLKDHLGLQEKITWLTKDLVLECSALSLPSDTSCAIIPQNYPEKGQVIFHRGQEVIGLPKWDLPVAYMLESGVSIRVKGTVRFYAITFKSPTCCTGA